VNIVSVLFRQLLGTGRTRSATSSRPVIVLGMHRSGTSFLTGSLQLAGLDLGNHSTWNPHNLKGNRENGDIVAFHDAVLAARGHVWNNPPVNPVVWSPEEQAQARNLIAAYDRTGPWGFKDPRTLLMTDAWREICPEARFVGIFRNPVAVCRSLRRRSQMTEAAAYALWEAYNRRLLDLCLSQPFPLLCFDMPEAELHEKLNRVLPDLGLKPLRQEVFFSPELRHHDSAPEVVPEALRPLYAALGARQC